MPSIQLTPTKLVERARKTARGSLPPAGTDPETRPGLDGRDRRLIRQRLRRTRRVGDARVTELGVLVAEMKRRDRWNSELLEEWTSELEQARRESHALDEALKGDGKTLTDLENDGVIAQCHACGRIGGASDSYCAGCGRELQTSTIR